VEGSARGHIQVGYISKFLTWAEELALAREMESLRSSGLVPSMKHKGKDTGRLGTSFGDEGVQYRFAGQTYEAKGWTPMILKIRNSVQKFSEKRINYCLLTIYPKGRVGLGWHKDDEREIIPRSVIASVSIGQGRMMEIKEDATEEVHQIFLEPRSLVLMGADTQKLTRHSIKTDPSQAHLRCSLTFRCIENPSGPMEGGRKEVDLSKWKVPGQERGGRGLFTTHARGGYYSCGIFSHRKWDVEVLPSYFSTGI